MTATHHQLLPGIRLHVDHRCVHLASDRPLTTLSSAVVGGGLNTVQHVINAHVHKSYCSQRPEDDLHALAADLGITGPFVGLMTAAMMDKARWAVHERDGVTVAAVVTAGLSNPTAAGLSEPGPWPDAPGTINAVIVADAALTPAALVNAVITITEAKGLALREQLDLTAQGHPPSGTSTDTVTVAGTGRGQLLPYAGPATTVGWLMATAVRKALLASLAA